MNQEPNSDPGTNSDLLPGILKLEPAPAFGQGSLPADQDLTFSMLAHPFALIIWLWKRKASPAVDAYGKEALNFGITMVLCMIPINIVAGLLGVTFAIIISALLSLVSLVMLAMVIYGMLKAGNGKLLRYPFNFRLIK